jgi:hypothetical protein
MVFLVLRRHYGLVRLRSDFDRCGKFPSTGMRGELSLLFVSALAVAFAGCNGASSHASAVPAITSLSQNSGVVGTLITITGTNFGATQGTSTVTFNGTSARTASAWSTTSITVAVPTGATTGNVVVTVGGQASNGVPFTVIPAPGTWP